jgi:hypothetical protein
MFFKVTPPHAAVKVRAAWGRAFPESTAIPSVALLSRCALRLGGRPPRGTLGRVNNKEATMAPSLDRRASQGNLCTDPVSNILGHGGRPLVLAKPGRLRAPRLARCSGQQPRMRRAHDDRGAGARGRAGSGTIKMMLTAGLGLVGLLWPPLALGAPVSPVVVPASVVRWSAVGTEACIADTRTWEPVGDTCFFPVDLLARGKIRLARRRAGQRETILVQVGRYPYGVQRLSVPRVWVHLTRAAGARVARENAEIAPLWTRESAPAFSLPLGPPLAVLPPGERFGARRFFNGRPRSPHSGMDYSAEAGTPVLAAADGVVALVADHFFAGTSVYVDHGGGLITMCFHLERADVAQGDTVRRGQTLGLVGATGRVLGPHLHFGVRWHGARVDPALLLGPPEDLPEIAR